MDNHALGVLATVIAGVLTVAIVAVIFGRQSQTAGVISSGGSALAAVIKAAVSPVSGGGSIMPSVATGATGVLVPGGAIGSGGS